MKTYYTISEVEKICNVKHYTLRYWEKIHPILLSPKKGQHGRRYYTEKDIQAINHISQHRSDFHKVISQVDVSKKLTLPTKQILAELRKIKDLLAS
ncbi:MerR family transcriptional regulator [Gammaproteobacteria bacterium]|nr:MerR family transcriptional regulator [Gammaproteobacteria bacterium]